MYRSGRQDRGAVTVCDERGDETNPVDFGNEPQRNARRAGRVVDFFSVRGVLRGENQPILGQFTEPDEVVGWLLGPSRYRGD